MDITCPFCLKSISLPITSHGLGLSEQGYVAKYVQFGICPSCQKQIVFLSSQARSEDYRGPTGLELIWPKFANHAGAPRAVPEKYAKDYREACNVISTSPNAAAALCRRCLQAIIRSELNITKGSLFEEIEDAIKMHALPPQIEEELDAIRHTGNFAAHPLNNTTTGQIIDVDLHEAEWSLSILADVFDFIFVQPAERAERKKKFSEKLSAAGKPPMK